MNDRLKEDIEAILNTYCNDETKSKIMPELVEAIDDALHDVYRRGYEDGEQSSCA